MDEKAYFVLAYHLGFSDGRSSDPFDEEIAWEEFQKRYSDELLETSEWIKRELESARETGFKEGQESALRSLEGANKKIYEG